MQGQKVYVKKKSYKCSTCKQVMLTSLDDFIYHKLTHASNRKKPIIKCGVCDKVFNHTSDLEQHKESHNGDHENLRFGVNVVHEGDDSEQNKKHETSGAFPKPDVEEKVSSQASEQDKEGLQSIERAFTCVVSHKTFDNNGKLNFHKKSHPKKKRHTGEKVFVCRICDMKFHRSFNFRRHKQLHTREKAFVCDICNMPFVSAHTLKRHKVIHTGKKAFTCDICNKKFARSYNFNRHQKTHSGEKHVEGDAEIRPKEEPNQLSNLVNDIHTNGDLVNDDQIHTNEGPYEDDLPGKKCVQPSYLQNQDVERHKRLHIEKTSVCDVNRNMKFAHSNTLKRGKRVRTRKTHYTCEICGKKFDRSYNYKRHIQTHNCERDQNLFVDKQNHTDEKPCECDICHKKLGLEQHRKRFGCDVCEKKFSLFNTLKRHKLVHTGEKAFTCDICDKKFARAFTLNRHKILHTPEKRITDDTKKVYNYECELCAKKFVHRSQLERHKIVHTGEKPFKCDICNKEFSSGLDRHKRLHTGERPYKCDICDKGFTQAAHLRSHTVLHSRKKLLKCKACGKKFIHRSQLSRHKKMHNELSQHTV